MALEPVTDRGRRSRDRILDAAVALIADRGVEAASLDRILAAADASKSQLYHYFAGKDDLVRAVIACRCDQTLDAQMPALSRLDSWTAIRGWLDGLVRENEANGFPGCAIGTMASELAGRDEAARDDLARCFTTWQHYLVDGLERMRARGELAPDADPQRLATAVFAGLQGGLLLAKTHRDSEPLRIALDAAYAHLRAARASR